MNTASTYQGTHTRFRLNAGYLFIAPALILILLLTVYPTYKIFDMSVHRLNRRTGENEFVGKENYEKILDDKVFRQAIRQTFLFAGGCVIGHISLGFALALLMNAGLNNRVLGISRSLILLPWVLSPAVVAILTQLWGHPLISPIAKILAALGWQGEFQPIGTVQTALFALIVINVWQYTPFYMLMILCGLQTIDEELHAAAMVDGANYIQRVYYIIWPHVRNVVITFALFSLVANIAYFDLIWIATQGGPVRSTEVLATYTYRLAFVSLNWNRASVAGIILLLLSILISIIFLFLMRRD